MSACNYKCCGEKKTTKFAIEQKEDEHLDETILFAHLFVFEVVLSSQF